MHTRHDRHHLGPAHPWYCKRVRLASQPPAVLILASFHVAFFHFRHFAAPYSARHLQARDFVAPVCCSSEHLTSYSILFLLCDTKISSHFISKFLVNICDSCVCGNQDVILDLNQLLDTVFTLTPFYKQANSCLVIFSQTIIPGVKAPSYCVFRRRGTTAE